MKRNYIRYIGSLLMGGILLLGACIKEDLTDNPVPPDPPVEGEGYLSFKIGMGDLAATKSTDTDPGTPEENQVNSVRVILYDPGVDTVKYAFHFNIQTNSSPGDNDYYTGVGVWANGVLRDESAVYTDHRTGEYKFITYAQKVDRQDYKMLVIINPTYEPETGEATVQSIPFKDNVPVFTRNDDDPESIHDWEKWNEPDYEDNPIKSQLNLHYLTRRGQPLSKMKTFYMPPRQVSAPGSIAFSGKGESPANFVMTNHQELIEVSKEQLQLDRDEAHAHPVPVSVDRVVAKVIVRQKAGGITVKPDGAQIGDIDYYIDYMNQYSYWWRRMTWLKGQYDYGVKETQGHSERALHYAEDPNFDGFYVEDGFEGEPSSELRSRNFFNSLDHESDLGKITKPLNAEHTVNYVLENTSTPDYQKAHKDYYTRVVVRANYIPKDITPGGSYYVFNDCFFSQEQMEKYCENVGKIAEERGYISGKWLEDPKIVQPFPQHHDDDPEGMWGLYYAIFTLYVEGFEGEEGTMGQFLNGSYGPQKAYGLSRFERGINYYTIPIRHFGFSGGENAGVDTYGYYGVVRNNIYTITINSISGPGCPTPTTPSEFGYISAGINIQPWTQSITSIDIGEVKPLVTYVTYKYFRGEATEPFQTDYDYDVTVGHPIAQDSEIRDRYYGSTNVPVDQYGHGVIKTSLTTVQGDPADNVVEIMYPALKAAPVVTFNYLGYGGQALYTVLKSPVTRTYAAGTELKIENIRADGLLPQLISYEDKVYTYADAYNGIDLAAPLLAGNTYQVNLFYAKPADLKKSVPPTVYDQLFVSDTSPEEPLTGTGIAGATITVYMDMDLDTGQSVSTTVLENGEWIIWAAAEELGIVGQEGLSYYAVQIEPDKLQSDRSNLGTTVIHK